MQRSLRRLGPFYGVLGAGGLGLASACTSFSSEDPLTIPAEAGSADAPADAFQQVDAPIVLDAGDAVAPAPFPLEDHYDTVCDAWEPKHGGDALDESSGRGDAGGGCRFCKSLDEGAGGSASFVQRKIKFLPGMYTASVWVRSTPTPSGPGPQAVIIGLKYEIADKDNGTTVSGALKPGGDWQQIRVGAQTPRPGTDTLLVTIETNGPQLGCFDFDDLRVELLPP